MDSKSLFVNPVKEKAKNKVLQNRLNSYAQDDEHNEGNNCSVTSLLEKYNIAVCFYKMMKRLRFFNNF